MNPKSLQKLLPKVVHPIFQTKRVQPGAPPGTLVSHPDRPEPVIDAIIVKANERLERNNLSVEEVELLTTEAPFIWVNVNGLGDAEIIRKLGEVFALHSLALEDVLNTPQRPKSEFYDNAGFIILRMPGTDSHPHVDLEQISIFWGEGFVLSFQERKGDVFTPIRQRIRNARGPLAKPAPDYLAYALIDSIIDSYFPLLEDQGEYLAQVEALILASVHKDSVAKVYRIKRELLLIRRAMWPQRDAIQTLYRDPGSLISDNTRIHLRDCVDHCNHIIDLLENYREISGSLLDLYLSMTSQRMNEIMKVLTIIATIFIPLTFIVGVYGMNFDPEASTWNMPELSWAYGYPAVMTLMLMIAIAMLFFFRQKGWLGASSNIEPPFDPRFPDN